VPQGCVAARAGSSDFKISVNERLRSLFDAKTQVARSVPYIKYLNRIRIGVSSEAFLTMSPTRRAALTEIGSPPSN
jgi:hypothetical protein